MKDGKQERKAKKEAFKEFVANHPYTQREAMPPEQIKALPKADRPDLAMRAKFLDDRRSGIRIRSFRALKNSL